LGETNNVQLLLRHVIVTLSDDSVDSIHTPRGGWVLGGADIPFQWSPCRRSGSVGIKMVSTSGAEISTPPLGFRFVDLFAGVGGFHAALRSYGGKCVYAVEIDPAAAAVYHRNWGHDPLGDITADVNSETMNVPEHEILTAGFPCQPFSKSGAQKGMDETRGTLYWNILRIVEKRKPKIVLLENVRNLTGPRHQHEWAVIIETLRKQGYRVSNTPAIFSPHLLPPENGGRPQNRERVLITATHNPTHIGGGAHVQPIKSTKETVTGFDPKTDWNLNSILDDTHNVPSCVLTAAERLWVTAWNEWVELWYKTTNGTNPPTFPIWADAWVNYDNIITRHGTVPGYRVLMNDDPGLPQWKAMNLAKNYTLYRDHRAWIDMWATKHEVYTSNFPPSRRKLEWQARNTPRLWDTVMHFRPSGIRCKEPTYLPALVAIAQTSIIGPRERRISPREAARLQGLPDWFNFGTQTPAATYKQMGNGVNVGVVWNALRNHVERDTDILRTTPEGLRIMKAVLTAPLTPDVILNAAQ
jgi:DNA (cytosine-5)-methyltransferase 1